jgi:WD40 repeat protein
MVLWFYGLKFNIVRWDTRKKPDSPVAVIEAHPEEINCLSFNPYDGVYCVTGSNDKVY